MIENGTSKGHVTSIKELIWDKIAFLAGNAVSKGHVVSGKELVFR